MKLSSTQLQAFLAARINTGLPANVFHADLYTFCTGAGRASLNEKYTPSGGAVTVVTPFDTLGRSGAFLQDLGVREANGDCLQVAGSVSAGKYTVNNSTGVYGFNDNNRKLISYLYRYGQGYGMPAPIVYRLCSEDRNITVWGRTFFAAGKANNYVDPDKPFPAIQRSKIRLATGLEVASMEIQIFANAENSFDTLPIVQQVANGRFDGAAVYVQRLIMPAPWGTPVPGGVLESGIYILFSGSVAEQQCGRSKIKMQVRARTELLDQNMPRRLVGPSCGHALFDNGCTLDPAAFLVTAAAQSGSNFSVIKTNLNTSTFPGPISAPTSAPTLNDTSASNLNLNPTQYWVVVTYTSALGETTQSPQSTRSVAKDRLLTVASPPSSTGATGYNVYAGTAPGNLELQNAAPIAIGTGWTENGNGLYQGSPPPAVNTGGWFDQGVICFTSGALAGQFRPVSQYLGDGSVTVVPGFNVAPSPGDTFTILPGCSKTLPTCEGKFNNRISFGGYPFLPSPETVI